MTPTFHPVENETPKALTVDQLSTYNELGYVEPLHLFSHDEANAHRAYFDELLSYFTDHGRGSYDINGFHARCTPIYDIATHPTLLDYIEDLIGPNIICWGTHYFCKLPGDVKRVAYHQDATYWPFTPTKTVTAWLAIDDVNEGNGPMCFLPGSHLGGARSWHPVDKDVVLNQETDHLDSLAPPHPVLLKAGQCSLHTDLLVHGSEANQSSTRRCGLTLRYVPSDVWIRDDQYKGWTRSAIVCRGGDPSGLWPCNPRPGNRFPQFSKPS
ncbi:MAG: phytanoyl-CoA dioxygenase family protein [Pseudomonadota bacterium]